MTEEIVRKLDQLANCHAERDYLALEKQALIDQVLTPEIKARLDEIEAEFAGRFEAVEANITRLEGEVRDEVIKHGATVRGTFLHAVWNKGRVTWDTKAMEDYAGRHPEILAYRKEGKPSVSLRKV